MWEGSSNSLAAYPAFLAMFKFTLFCSRLSAILDIPFFETITSTSFKYKQKLQGFNEKKVQTMGEEKVRTLHL